MSKMDWEDQVGRTDRERVQTGVRDEESGSGGRGGRQEEARDREK